jgi:hypothetical protein
VQAVFKAADKDANGTLTKDEIVAILHNSDMLFSCAAPITRAGTGRWQSCSH